MKIRLPEDLKQEIEVAAQANGRSMNAEIVARLQGSFAVQTYPAADARDLELLYDIATGQMALQQAMMDASSARDEAFRATMQVDRAEHLLSDAERKKNSADAVASARDGLTDARQKLRAALDVSRTATARVDDLREALSGLHIRRVTETNGKDLRNVQPVSVGVTSHFSDAVKPKSGTLPQKKPAK